MMPSEKKNSRILIITIVFSLLCHLLILLIPVAWLEKSPEKEQTFLVKRLVLDEKGQVVDQTPDANQTEPDRAKYLSQFNNKVEKETRAPLVGDPHQTPPSLKPQPEKEIKKEKIDEPTLIALKKKDAPKKPEEKKPSWEDLTTLTKKPEQRTKMSATDDYLPETEVGSKTILNTKEFLYYSYYARIKERLRMIWAPSLRPVLSKLYFAGKEFEKGELITKVRVTLSREGSLKSIQLLEGSGFGEIDQVAIKAFEKAAPFPNPPSGMVEEDGQVYLRWDFILTTSSGPLLNVFVSKK